jgi:hypothetical protein
MQKKRNEWVTIIMLLTIIMTGRKLLAEKYPSNWHSMHHDIWVLTQTD